MVKEIGMAEFELPEGYVGNLTEEHEGQLREMWLEFFACIEKAQGKGGAEGGAGQATVGVSEEDNDPKKSGIPKGDEAKEEAKKKEEEKAMNDLLNEYGQDALRNSFWRFVKFDDPDTIMLRFLRARKWDVGRAIAMMAGCLKWRLDNKVELLAEEGDLGNGKIEKFLEQQRSGKTYAFGTANTEMPIAYIHVGKHNTFAQPTASMQKYVIYAMESFRLYMMNNTGKVEILFDMTGFGLKSMDWNVVLFLVKCLEAYFPESLDVMYVYNAPWIFWGVWKVLGPLLDPVVRAKVCFTNKAEDMKDKMPSDRLLPEVGGKTTNKFVFIEPKEGENKLVEDKAKRDELLGAYLKTAEEYETVTRKWAEARSDSVDAETLEKRKLLVKKLRVAQFEQEPYFRGKTQSHRDGTLDGQGIVTWLYKQKDGEDIRHIVGRRYCVAVMKREIKEIEEGQSVKDAEAKTVTALGKSDWVTLYGDEETARRIEGVRVDGKVPEETGPPDEATIIAGGHASSAAVAGVAAAGATGAAAAAVASGTAKSGEAASEATVTETPADFQDAPQAAEKETKQAADGDKKVDETSEAKDPAAAEAETKANSDAKPDPPAKSNGVANGGATDYRSAKENGDVTGSIKEKTASVKDATKAKGDTLSRRFSKMMGRK